LGLAGTRGEVTAGAMADLLVFPARTSDPASDLLGLEPWDLSMILVDGELTVAADPFSALFEGDERPHTRVRHGDRAQTVLGDPVALLEQVTAALGYEKILPFLPLARA